MERLAAFAATKFGKWLIGGITPALGAGAAILFTTLIGSVHDLNLSEPLTFLIGSILGSIAGRFGIPSPPVAGDKS